MSDENRMRGALVFPFDRSNPPSREEYTDTARRAVEGLFQCLIEEYEFETGVRKKICRVCGCTDLDCRQCVEAQGTPCVWVDGQRNSDGPICSRCYVATDSRGIG